MTIIVSLNELVGEMQTLSSETHTYLNKVTGQFFIITEEVIQASRDEEDLQGNWMKDVVEEYKKVQETDDYLKLPSQFNINEYHMMEDFCYSLSNERIREDLLRRIKGSGAFRRFKASIAHYGIENTWRVFQDNAYKKIAIEWLEEHNLNYVDDMKKKKKV